MTLYPTIEELIHAFFEKYGKNDARYTHLEGAQWAYRWIAVYIGNLEHHEKDKLRRSAT